jgi:prophage tail gpP-like protein
VSVNGKTLITGYVDDRNPTYDAGGHTLEISGRDRTGDLVDCSAQLGHVEFRNVNVLDLATKICDPFKIKVSAQDGLKFKVVPKLSISVGETAFNVIEQACKLAAVLATATADGNLLLTWAGAGHCSTSLVEGENIKRCEAKFSSGARFAKYVVLGQNAGTDDFFGKKAAHVRGEASDPNVKRSERVLVIRAEGGATSDYAQRRAQWEATVRASRADNITVTLQGWTQANGDLWPVNQLVSLRSPRVGIDGELLITQATFTVDDGGTNTVLTLKRPDAFKPEPTVSSDALWKEIAHGV